MKAKADILWAQIKAKEVLRALCITKPDEVRIRDIAYLRGVLVLEGPLKSGEARLVTKSGLARAIVRVREDIPEPGRKRFAIAHELGHWELHRGSTQSHLLTSVIVDRAYAGSTQEIEASAFASEILMPEDPFRSACGDRPPTIETVSALATDFRTTLTATALRYVAVTCEVCAVVVSSDGIVRWFQRSKEMEEKGLWLDPGSPIGSGTYAHDCLSGEANGARRGDVAAEEWFPHERGLYGRRIQESSMCLGNYGTVITLLWIKARVQPHS